MIASEGTVNTVFHSNDGICFVKTLFSGTGDLIWYKIEADNEYFVLSRWTVSRQEFVEVSRKKSFYSVMGVFKDIGLRIDRCVGTESAMFVDMMRASWCLR